MAEVKKQSTWGWVVESQTESSAILTKGKDKQVNHLLHLILTVFTLGLWAIVWVLQALGGGGSKRRLSISVGFDGQVTQTKS